MYFGSRGGAQEFGAFLEGNYGRESHQCICKGVEGEICHHFRFVPYDVQDSKNALMAVRDLRQAYHLVRLGGCRGNTRYLLVPGALGH